MTTKKILGLVWAIASKTDCEVNMRFDTPEQANAFVAGIDISKVVDDVIEERQRQIVDEGWSSEHDDEHGNGDMAAAAACYALSASAENSWFHRVRKEAAKELWPWDRKWWKPKNSRRDLVRAAALLIAEIERLDRASAKVPNDEVRGASRLAGEASSREAATSTVVLVGDNGGTK